MAARLRRAGYRIQEGHVCVAYRDHDDWHQSINLAPTIFDSRDIYREAYPLLCRPPTTTGCVIWPSPASSSAGATPSRANSSTTYRSTSAWSTPAIASMTLGERHHDAGADAGNPGRRA